MNPELARNAWLELTPVKRWTLPAVVLLLCVIALTQHGMGATLAEHMQDLTIVGFGLFGVFGIWGSTKALMSVTQEIAGNTWDMQRLAQHRPWDLVLGKLFGATVYEWYGGAIALAVFVLSRLPNDPLPLVALYAYTMVAMALAMQAGALFLSLAGANAVRSMRRPPKGGSQGLGLILSLLVASGLVPALFELVDPSGRALPSVTWWWTMPLNVFLPLSATMFFGWALAGCHRLVRAELQERVGPKTWLGFLAFAVFYLVPLSPLTALDVGSVALLGATSCLVSGAFIHALLFGERKDVVRLRQLADLIRRGDREAVVDQLPLWTYTLAWYTVSLAVLLVGVLVHPTPEGLNLALVATGVWLLLLRDIGLVLALYLSPARTREPGILTIFSFATLYVLLPALIAAAGLGTPLLAVLLPFMVAGLTSLSDLASAWPLLLALPTAAAPLFVARTRITRALKSAED